MTRNNPRPIKKIPKTFDELGKGTKRTVTPTLYDPRKKGKLWGGK